MSLADGARIAPATAPFTALAVTLSVQAIAAVAMTCPSVLAPVIAKEIGVGAQHVGWLVSLAYLAAMLSGLASGSLAQRAGPVRVSQQALIASALGIGLMAIGYTPVLLLGAVILGIGYGLPNPTAADILSRHAPAHRRGLFFSIKQTGVPIGVAITGLLMPALLMLTSWRLSLLALAGLMALVAWMLAPTRGRLDPPRRASAVASSASAIAGASSWVDILREKAIAPVIEVMRHPPTRRLALASLIYATTQVSFLTFLVSLLNLEHHRGLALSASLLAASQVVSVAARIGWGHVADRWIDPSRLLGGLGLAMAVAVFLLGRVSGETPQAMVLLITLACAATAVSWNGVFFADLVRHVPPEAVTRTTGATQFLTFMGGMGGAAAFAAMVSALDSYAKVYQWLAVLPALIGMHLLLAGKRE